MKKIFCFIIALISLPVFATNFYVSNTGDDEALGTSAETAWQTLSKVNNSTFSGGDTIFLQRGGVWREQLTIPSSGSEGSYIVISCYGEGEKPLILGSNISSGWEDQGGNIWKSTTTFTVNPWISSTYYSEIFYYSSEGDITWPTHVANTGLLTAEYQWTWLSDYIYIYSPTNPGTRYSKIEVPQRNYGIYLPDRQYIAIENIDVRHAKNINIYDNDPAASLSGFSLIGCELSYLGSRDQATGYNLAVCRNEYLVQNCLIHNGGRRQLSFHVYDADGLTFSGITIEGSTFHDGYHGSGIGIAMDGSRNNNHFQNIIIRGNQFYDSPTRDADSDGWDQSAFCSLRAQETGSSIDNAQVYNNTFKYCTSYALNLDGCNGVNVYHNTFYNFNLNTTGLYMYHILIATEGVNTDIDIKNNIFYGTQTYSVTGKTKSITIDASQNTSEISMNYNLFYELDTYMTMVQVGSTNYRTTNWSSLNSTYGWQANEPGNLDPLFVDAPDDISLSENSPAIAGGVSDGITIDILGNLYNETPSLGAYEYNSSPPVADLPSVISDSIVIDNPSNIVLHGNVTGDGGATVTERGFCWATTTNPTKEDNYNISGTGTGTYTVVIKLRPGIYHGRSYAVNSAGTVYGADISFTVPVKLCSFSKLFVKNGKYLIF